MMSYPKKSEIATPRLIAGPKTICSPRARLPVDMRNIAQTPPSSSAMKNASNVSCQPSKKPHAAISLMSPPPNAPFTTRVIMSNGMLIMKKPITRSSSVACGKNQIAATAKTAIAITSEFGIFDVCKSITEIASRVTVTPNARIVSRLKPNRIKVTTARSAQDSSTRGY